MKNLIASTLILGFTSFCFTGCSFRVLDFTLISSKNVDLSKATTFIRGKSRVDGKDMMHLIIIIPTGTASIKEALDRAIESTPGCVALLDGVVYSKFWYIPYIYGQQSAVVEGTPLIDPSLGYNQSDIPTYGKIEINKGNGKGVIEEISEQEFLALKSNIVKDSNQKKFTNSTDIE
ncbi:MAG: hypothetical protein JNJ85_02505 [Candidatus Kapabacteria bacterium]|nr:hypothetical protein [Candidatus Kapabacteria bacterium]